MDLNRKSQCVVSTPEIRIAGGGAASPEVKTNFRPHLEPMRTMLLNDSDVTMHEGLLTLISVSHAPSAFGMNRIAQTLPTQSRLRHRGSANDDLVLI